MPQCKEVHPNSPRADIFICIKEASHVEQDPPPDHQTYDVDNKRYYWPVDRSHICLESGHDWLKKNPDGTDSSRWLCLRCSKTRSPR